MNVATGKYTGTGTALSVTGVGFQPTCVIVQRDAANYEQVWATDSMIVGNSQTLATGTALTDGILSLDADGFSMGDNAVVNTSDDVIGWIAMAPGDPVDFATGTYTGNNTDSRAIEGLGFQPVCVWTSAVNLVALVGAFETDHVANGDDSYRLNETHNGATNAIQNMLADGFELGTSSNVNGNTIVYHWVAFGTTASSIEQGTYNSDSVDDRTITLADSTITPVFCMIKGDQSIQAAYRFGVNDGSSWLPNGNGPAGATGDNLIQLMSAGSFQIGTENQVNFSTGVDYHYLVLQNLLVPTGGNQGLDFSHTWTW